MKERIVFINKIVAGLILLGSIVSLLSIFNTEQTMRFLENSNKHIFILYGKIINNDMYRIMSITGLIISTGLTVTLYICSKYMIVFYILYAINSIVHLISYYKYYNEIDNFYKRKLTTIESMIVFTAIIGIIIILNIVFKTFIKEKQEHLTIGST